MSDEDLRRLFESVSGRGTPPADVHERVRAAVREAWEDLPRARRSVAATAAYAVVASAVVVAVAGWLLWMPRPVEPPAVVGEVAYATGGHGVMGNHGLDAPLVAGGATVETTRAGRALLRLNDGALLRLDAATRLTVHSGTDVGLAHGRLFVDSAGSDVRVATRDGIRIENAGTQFEVAVEDERVVVAVREGRVALRVGERSIRSEAQGGMGEAVVLEGANVVSRERTPATGARWDWIHGSMPAFELDGATVFEYLTWATAEAGVTLEFASEGVARLAKAVRLHGPPVPPERIGVEEIRATLQTAPSLQISRSEDYRLVVDWSSSASAGEPD